MSWMQRLRRVFDIDPSYCPRGGAQLRVIAAITEPALIATVLQHLAMRDEHGRGTTIVNRALGCAVDAASAQ